MPPPSLNSGAIPIEVLFSEPILLVTLKQTVFWVRHTSPRYLLSPLRKLEFHRRFKIILKVSNGLKKTLDDEPRRAPPNPYI